MLRTFVLTAAAALVVAGVPGWAAGDPESEVRDFIARWNAAYTGLDAAALAAMETPDFHMVDRFGHWIQSEGPEFNRRLWTMTFQEIYHNRPGPARRVENIRFMAPAVAVVQARAWHPDPIVLDDGTKIPPFWEINTYTLLKTTDGWRVSVMNIHNQMGAAAERPGEHVPDASSKPKERKY
jgi:ketosteroid isomerase-like protein